VKHQDANPNWPSHVEIIFKELAKSLGYEFGLRALAMSYKREILPKKFAEKDELSQDMVGVDFLITANGSKNPNIEDTLIGVSLEGLSGDYKALSLLVNWLEIRQDATSADRLAFMFLIRLCMAGQARF